MVLISSTLGRHLSAAVAFVFFLGVEAMPLSSFTNVTGRGVADVKRASAAPPYWVTYQDKTAAVAGPPDPSTIKGFNVFNLAFYLSTGAFDQAAVWANMGAAQRSTIKTQYAAAGIKLMVSAFGSTEQPTTAGLDPTTLANAIGQFVVNNDLDGVDVDYEDLTAITNGSGGEAWLITFTKQLRTVLPKGQYIITHAPLAPWFSPSRWAGGGYLKVHQEVGDLIDWYNVQFYNQGTDYTTCDGLLNTSSGTYPQSAVFQIAASGVPLNKIVIGKPGVPADAGSGYMEPAILAGCLATAKAQGWSAGAMMWEYPDADASWINTVRGSAF
ncbi:glycoside hydrolase family 18 protein [Roridomyces roridus]|uniref:Glycoside hydrolase family 18 protein n=1 Tax=Roridomyces roridus TaxID=1738132 RepID=A0AAD7BN63_9AGAR|nr:glycoside hydrolase family 18 protein [Roridomyces roridus]